MKFGINVTRYGSSDRVGELSEKIAELAVAADRAGFYSLWVSDHFLQTAAGLPLTDPMLEAYTTLGFLAGITEHILLGTLVGGVTYREPALTVKAVTTLDVLSGGRAYWGIGGGWNGEEAEALGLMSPLGNDRFARLEEALQIGEQMWSGEQKPFKGAHYHLGRTLSSPQPVRKPHPPIMVGGGGEQKTLRLVARYADACNIFSDEDVAHKLEVLQRHCKEVGRDYNKIEKTVLIKGFRFAQALEEPEKLLDLASELARLGIEHIMIGNSPECGVSDIKRFGAELLPKFQAL